MFVCRIFWAGGSYFFFFLCICRVFLREYKFLEEGDFYLFVFVFFVLFFIFWYM